MPRNVTVTLSSGETLQFANVPDDVTPDQIQARAESESGGATVVSIDGGRGSATPAAGAPVDSAPTTADAVPMDGVAPQAPQEDVAGYEAALRGLYQRYAEKKQPFNTADISAIASKYNVGPITNLGEIEEFYNKYGTLNPSLKSVSLDAPAAPTPTQDEMVGAVPQGSENAQRIRRRGRSLPARNYRARSSGPNWRSAELVWSRCKPGARGSPPTWGRRARKRTLRPVS